MFEEDNLLGLQIDSKRLPVSFSVATGELIYSIRKSNPEYRYYSPPDLTQPPVIFKLKKRCWQSTIEPGNSGEIVLWPSGEQTRFEVSRPVRNSKRYATWYILRKWFKADDSHRETAYGGGYSSLTASIMDHIVDEKPDQPFTFQREGWLTDEVFIDTAVAIQYILSQALGIQTADVTQSNIKTIQPFILHSLFDFGSRSRPVRGESVELSTLGRFVQWIDKKLKSEEQTETLPIETITTPDQKKRYGMEKINELVERCVEVTFREQMDFHEQVLALFFESINKITMQTPVDLKQPNQAEISLRERIPNVGHDREIFDMRIEGATVAQIGARFNLSIETVFRRISAIRELLGEENVPYRRRDMQGKGKKQTAII